MDDERHYVDLTTFGFFQGGVLDVRMVNFMLPSSPVVGEYGFTLDRTVNDAINPYLEAHSDTCFLKESDNSIVSPQHPAIVFLKMDFKNSRFLWLEKKWRKTFGIYPLEFWIRTNRNFYVFWHINYKCNSKMGLKRTKYEL